MPQYHGQICSNGISRGDNAGKMEVKPGVLPWGVEIQLEDVYPSNGYNCVHCSSQLYIRATKSAQNILKIIILYK